jgi:hypothetical protein
VLSGRDPVTAAFLTAILSGWARALKTPRSGAEAGRGRLQDAANG